LQLLIISGVAWFVLWFVWQVVGPFVRALLAIIEFIVDSWPFLLGIGVFALAVCLIRIRVPRGDSATLMPGTPLRSFDVAHAQADRQVAPPKPSTTATMEIGANRITIPTRGWIIHHEPIEKIIARSKTMELRSKPNLQLGPVALIEEGGKGIRAIANYDGFVGPMSWDEFRARAREHGVEPERQWEQFNDRKRVYGWLLSDVRPIDPPIESEHRGQGRVVLSNETVARLRRRLRG
jgi:hypothetical protein